MLCRAITDRHSLVAGNVQFPVLPLLKVNVSHLLARLSVVCLFRSDLAQDLKGLLYITMLKDDVHTSNLHPLGEESHRGNWYWMQ